MPKRTLEEVERLLGRLSPEEPSARVDSRILSRASGNGRQAPWRLAALAVLSGVAAVVCFEDRATARLLFRDPRPESCCSRACTSSPGHAVRGVVP